MKKHFYSDFVQIDVVRVELDALNLNLHEKNELIHVAHHTIHHAVIESVLARLPQDLHAIFIRAIEDETHESIWILLERHMHNPEELIKTTIADVVELLLTDVRSVTTTED